MWEWGCETALQLTSRNSKTIFGTSINDQYQQLNYSHNFISVLYPHALVNRTLTGDYSTVTREAKV
jgi:hypothetical protein